MMTAVSEMSPGQTKSTWGGPPLAILPAALGYTREWRKRLARRIIWSVVISSWEWKWSVNLYPRSSVWVNCLT